MAGPFVRRNELRSPQLATEPEGSGPPSVYVRNDTGGTVRRFGCLRVSESVVSAIGNPDRFTSRMLLKGVTPSSGDLAVSILQMPLQNIGDVGEGCLSGETFARLSGPTGKKYANPADDQTLLADDSGSFIIIFDPGPADSERVGIVRFARDVPTIPAAATGSFCDCSIIDPFDSDQDTAPRFMRVQITSPLLGTLTLNMEGDDSGWAYSDTTTVGCDQTVTFTAILTLGGESEGESRCGYPVSCASLTWEVTEEIESGSFTTLESATYVSTRPFLLWGLSNQLDLLPGFFPANVDDDEEQEFTAWQCRVCVGPSHDRSGVVSGSYFKGRPMLVLPAAPECALDPIAIPGTITVTLNGLSVSGCEMPPTTYTVPLEVSGYTARPIGSTDVAGLVVYNKNWVTDCSMCTGSPSGGNANLKVDVIFGVSRTCDNKLSINCTVGIQFPNYGLYQQEQWTGSWTGQGNGTLAQTRSLTRSGGSDTSGSHDPPTCPGFTAGLSWTPPTTVTVS